MNNTVYQRDIKVSFKSCSSEDRKNFPNASCILPISIGQKVHEGEKFAATLKLIEKSFQRCTILLDDSIQKYTLKITSNEDLEILHQKAITAGTEWLDRQRTIIKSLSIKCDIMRWDDWVNKPLFVKMYEQVLALYYKNVEYKISFDNTARTFLLRFLQAHSSGVAAEPEEEGLARIDLALAMQRIGAKTEDAAIEGLSILLKSLEEDIPVLKKAEKNNDIEGAREVLHKIRGGLCYSGTPRLEEAIKKLHAEVKRTSKLSEIDYHFSLVYAEAKLLGEQIKKMLETDNK